MRIDLDPGVGLFGEVKDAAGVGTQRVIKVLDGQSALVDGGQEERQCGF